MPDTTTMVSPAGIRVVIPADDRGEFNRLRSIGWHAQPAAPEPVAAPQESNAPSPALEAPYDDHTKDELRDEIDRRNSTRGDDDQIDVDSHARKNDLIKALEADDAAHQENA